MRISGWSSDVCSSDLASTSRWRTRPSAETAYSTPRCPSRAAYSTMLAFGAKLGDSSSDPGDSVDQRGDPRLRSSNAIRYTLPLPRSEEHTSELQSLMRISYAVFCLKKKKHNTK